MKMSSNIDFKKKMKVQALDPETKTWLLATILEVAENQSKLTWSGFSRQYDCWISHDEIRTPVIKRALLSRNAINISDFPNRGEPKYLEKDDQIYDTLRKTIYTVATNDPFEAKVSVLAYYQLINIGIFIAFIEMPKNYFYLFNGFFF